MSAPPSPAPFDITIKNDKFHIREAQYDEIDGIGWAAGGAFLDDRIISYMAQARKPATSVDDPDGAHIAWFYTFLMKVCHLGGGRIIVALASSTPDTPVAPNGLNVAGAACWYPPGKRLKMKYVLKGGVLKVFKAWGRLGLKRGDEFTEVTHKVFQKSFHSLSPKKLGEEIKQDDAWYLHIMFTAKAFEGRGLMSLLMREGYAYARSQSNTRPFILESSSERSRDRYAHLGFELLEPETLLGVGKVDSRGLKATKGDGEKRSRKMEGTACYCMANWNPNGENSKEEVHS